MNYTHYTHLCKKGHPFQNGPSIMWRYVKTKKRLIYIIVQEGVIGFDLGFSFTINKRVP